MTTDHIPADLLPWVEAKKRHRLAQVHIQMARELGMDPKSFRRLDNHKQEHWKAPLRQYICELYQKRFKKAAPDRVLSFEEISQLKARKKEVAMQRKARAKTSDATPDSEEPFS